eukprot:1156229-Pelagomonas_calceolata.AAC.8
MLDFLAICIWRGRMHTGWPWYTQHHTDQSAVTFCCASCRPLFFDAGLFSHVYGGAGCTQADVSLLNTTQTNLPCRFAVPIAGHSSLLDKGPLLNARSLWLPCTWRSRMHTCWHWSTQPHTGHFAVASEGHATSMLQFPATCMAGQDSHRATSVSSHPNTTIYMKKQSPGAQAAAWASTA